MTVKHSGYLVAAQSVAWSSGQALDSLTDNEFTDLSDEIDNTSNLYLMADVEIYLPSVAFTGADSRIRIYVVPTVDGTNYPNWVGNGTADEQENENYFVGAVTTSGATENNRMVKRAIELPPGKFKMAFRNVSNVTLTTSCTAKWRPWSYQDV